MRLGLTGGIGSGKSLAAEYFTHLGVPVFDADALVRNFDEEVIRAFPLFITATGSIDRNRLRQHILSHKEDREILEDILHPLVIRSMIQMSEHHKDQPYVVWMLPLLIEKPLLLSHVDRILVIDCSTKTQIKRVQERNSWSTKEIESILNIQASRKERVHYADDIIINEGSTVQLLNAISEKHRYYLSMTYDSHNDKVIP